MAAGVLLHWVATHSPFRDELNGPSGQRISALSSGGRLTSDQFFLLQDITARAPQGHAVTSLTHSLVHIDTDVPTASHSVQRGT